MVDVGRLRVGARVNHIALEEVLNVLRVIRHRRTHSLLVLLDRGVRGEEELLERRQLLGGHRHIYNQLGRRRKPSSSSHSRLNMKVSIGDCDGARSDQMSIEQ